jgi:hypothetical protein
LTVIGYEWSEPVNSEEAVEASVSLSPVPSAFLEVAAQGVSTARWEACLVVLAAIQVWVSTVVVAQALTLHSDSLYSLQAEKPRADRASQFR